MKPLPGISGEPSSVRLVLRFCWVAMLTAIGVTFLAHLFIPQADPAHPVDPGEPAEILLGIGVWSVIILVPTLDLLRIHRRTFDNSHR